MRQSDITSVQNALLALEIAKHSLAGSTHLVEVMESAEKDLRACVHRWYVLDYEEAQHELERLRKERQ